MSTSHEPPESESGEDRTARPNPDGPETPVDSEELVAEDDAIIGRALRVSLSVLAGVTAVVAAVVYLASRSDDTPPPQPAAATSPRAVADTATPPAVAFVDRAAEAGIDFTHFNGAYGQKLLPETMGSGIAVFDFDNDGDQDILLVNGAAWPWAPAKTGQALGAGSALYLNDGGGGFRNASRETGLADLTRDLYGMGVAVGDYDSDGSVDLFLTAVGENRLLRQANGGFEDVTDRAGVAGAPADWSTGATFFDMDLDGDLDLFVCHYVVWSQEIDLGVDFRLTGVGRAYGPPQNYEGRFSSLYRNDGGRFEDVSAEAGIEVRNPATGVAMGKALSVAPIDMDGDGLIDLIVANDTVRNFVFHNLGGGRFEEVGELYGMAYDRDGNATGAMGIDTGYFRNDGSLGVAVGNFANEMTSLYVSQGDPSFFLDEAIGEGIGAPSRRVLSFGLFLFDYDLDGRLDMLQVNGHLEEAINTVDASQTYRQPVQLYWNAGDDGPRRFVLVPAETTGDLARPLVGRGSAYADFDGDGDLDIVLTQLAGPPLLLRNDQATGHHWLRVKLVGRAPNRDAIGAWIEVTTGGVTQRRQVMPTKSYLSQVELPVTFGLGPATRIDRLSVIWPDGRAQDVPPPTVDQIVVIEAPND